MKLILAIINFDDANSVTHALTKKGFSSTKLATTGGFLMAGNVTILVGVDEEKVQAVIDIIKEHSHSRKQMIPTTTEVSYGYYPSMPVEVTVGGATIFVVDIERSPLRQWFSKTPAGGWPGAVPRLSHCRATGMWEADLGGTAISGLGLLWGGGPLWRMRPLPEGGGWGPPGYSPVGGG